MQNKKVNNLIKIALMLLITGFIFLFINMLVGLLFVFTFLIFAIFLNIKYPNELKNFRDNANKFANENKERKILNKKYSIVHIDVINVAENKQKCTLTISPINVIFTDSENNILDEIEFSKIKNIRILQQIKQSQKEKSPVCRAIIGGVLLGPVGAVVGGASGLTPTFKSDKKYYIEIERPEPDDNIIFTGSNKDIQELNKIISERV